MTNPSSKSILITGCSSGIGLCCAAGLKERGYRVFATARNIEDVEMLKTKGFESYQLDLDSSESIQQALDDILKKTQGQLFALFNNGAYAQPGAVEDLSREILRQNFETNLFGTHELTCMVVKVMRKQGYGRIVQNSSLLGYVSMAYRGSYNASKYALEGLTDAMRLELSDTDIKISLIEPGPITSAFRKNAFAMYQKNIDKTDSAHREKYEGMEKRLTKEGPAAPFTLPPEAVLKKLIHALESPKPKIRYPVTFPAYLFAFLRRFATSRFLDRLLLKVAKNENQ